MPDDPSPGLFPESDLPKLPPALALRERLVAAYRDELLREHPIKSVDALLVGEDNARRTADYIARHQDVPRLLRAVQAAGLEISRAGRLSDLLEILADFLTLSDAAPGTTCEGDWDDLLTRARAALTPGQHCQIERKVPR